MGAGQIGGIATLLDIDFNNAAGFLGKPATNAEAQYIVQYFSHAMLFCAGALIEPHVVLTPAACVVGERNKFEVTGGTHRFLEYLGTRREVDNVCIHRGYNSTERWDVCPTDNIALLVLTRPFSFRHKDNAGDFIINRVRYGVEKGEKLAEGKELRCSFFGWGSRRNGYLVPLLLDLRRVEVRILPNEKCDQIWNTGNKFLCLHPASCRSEKFGALCPDDIGSVIECGGFVTGMMVSRLVDRPCGVGFLDLAQYSKFLTCGVDDSRDVIDHDAYMSIDFTPPGKNTPSIATADINISEDKETSKTIVPTGF